MLHAWRSHVKALLQLANRVRSSLRDAHHDRVLGVFVMKTISCECPENFRRTGYSFAARQVSVRSKRQLYDKVPLPARMTNVKASNAPMIRVSFATSESRAAVIRRRDRATIWGKFLIVAVGFGRDSLPWNRAARARLIYRATRNDARQPPTAPIPPHGVPSWER